MIKLFNRDLDGGSEITNTLGLIADRVDFAQWEPYLPAGCREVTAIIGPAPMEALSYYYTNYESGDPRLAQPLKLLQLAVALFTWLKIIPTLDAHHDANGRQRRLGENERGLTALEQYKDESNILKLAYEAVDNLVEMLDAEKFDFWVKSKKYTDRQKLLLRSKAEFDEFYSIGSARMYLMLMPIMSEEQRTQVKPVLGDRWTEAINRSDADLYELAARATALLSIRKAILRFPVSVLPEGIVQVSNSATGSQYATAEMKARMATADSLQEDAQTCLRLLETSLKQAVRSDAVGMPKAGHIHTKGMSF